MCCRNFFEIVLHGDFRQAFRPIVGWPCPPSHENSRLVYLYTGNRKIPGKGRLEGCLTLYGQGALAMIFSPVVAREIYTWHCVRSHIFFGVDGITGPKDGVVWQAIVSEHFFV